MKKSEIKFVVELDEGNIPERIMWDADEKDTPGLSETKSISLSLWDHDHRNTMRIDLWSKDMPIEDMKHFYIDCLGGIAQSVLNSTGDEYMNREIVSLCDKLVKQVKK